MPFKYQIHVTDKSSGLVNFQDGNDQLVVPNQPYPYLMHTNETKTSVAARISQEYAAQVPAKVTSDFNPAGVIISNVVVESVLVSFIKNASYTAYDFPLVPIAVSNYYLQVDYVFSFQTDVALEHSPLDPATIALLTKLFEITLGAVIVALVAYWIIQALKDVVTSMTTRKSTVEKYDWVLNPNTGLYEWKLVTKEDLQTPDYGGITLVIAGAVAIIVVIMVLMGYRGQKK